MTQPQTTHIVKVHQALRELTKAHQVIRSDIGNHAERETQRRDSQRKEVAQRQMLSAPLGNNGT